MKQDVIDLCRAVGLTVVEHSVFSPAAPAQVFGPLDSIAILLDLLMFEDQQECSDELILSVLAKSITDSDFDKHQ